MVFSRNRFAAIFLILAFAISGCKQITISNGEIPVEYLDLAQKYVATYQGRFNSNQGSLKIEMKDKKLHASFTGQINDITGDVTCESAIGDLKSLQVNDAGTILEAASFAFSPNHCVDIQGRSLDLIFVPDGPSIQMAATLLKETKEVQVCEPSLPPGSGEKCHADFENYYFSGVFEKTANLSF